eukprot:CAMPEP_0170874984 /NCGR_PEP_ID=MMETSP0734-20130129/28609_1 /TAXON_ID=186038 /ORGANISM="Fragilariopsis kerguelensis, Strain L26-C5" /LENGTH=58 /DNA_ID=CAMNT_0011256309 /DNA_START=300 /DNA_END=476 /DNA_ORIENTATION=-
MADNSTTSRKTGKYVCSPKEMTIATGYASMDKDTGMVLRKIGTKIPPPLQAKIREMNL